MASPIPARALPAFFVFLWCAWADVTAAELKPATVRAWDGYIHTQEARIEREVHATPFLWADSKPEGRSRLRAGEILTERRSAGDKTPGGVIHHWVGAAFYPNTTLDKTMALVQDYNHHDRVYAPEVRQSRLLERNGNDFRIHLRFLKKKVLTAVLDTEHQVRYVPISSRRMYSWSKTTRIVEIDNAGKPDERALPEGNDHGFMWRLNSYWRFEEGDGGVYAECEAISLSRDVPAGLRWLINPIVNDLPKESLANTLRATRTALGK
jgi:hypothetical protein